MNRVPLALSICVVLYKSEAMTRRFVAELNASLVGHDHVEVLFYDNSPDATLADAVGAHSYTHDPRNLGFSFANNQLILATKYPRILLLNPDVFDLTPGFWDRLIERAPAGQVRLIKLLNSDGSHQDCVGEPTSLARAFSATPDYAAIDTPRVVGMGIMAFLLADRDVYARVGLLDCDYPLYGEDMDWCYRAGRAGIPVVYDPGLRLTHVGGGSAADRWSRAQSMRAKYRAERIFVTKHAHGLNRTALLLLNRVKAWARAR